MKTFRNSSSVSKESVTKSASHACHNQLSLHPQLILHIFFSQLYKTEFYSKLNTFGSLKSTYIPVSSSGFHPKTEVKNPPKNGSYVQQQQQQRPIWEVRRRENLKLSKWVGLIWEKGKWVDHGFGRVGVEMGVGVG